MNSMTENFLRPQSKAWNAHLSTSGEDTAHWYWIQSGGEGGRPVSVTSCPGPWVILSPPLEQPSQGAVVLRSLLWVRNPQQWLLQVHHPAPAGVPTVPAFPTYGTSHLLPVASFLLVQRGFQGIPAWHSGRYTSEVRGTRQVNASFFLCKWVVLRCMPYCFSVHGNKPQLTCSGFQVTAHPRFSLLP